MQSLEDLKRRISTTLFITGDEVQRVCWPDNTPPPEIEALENTTICLIVVGDGRVHIGANQALEGGGDEASAKDAAFDRALGEAYAYYEALDSYPDTSTAELDFEAQSRNAPVGLDG